MSKDISHPGMGTAEASSIPSGIKTPAPTQRTSLSTKKLASKQTGASSVSVTGLSASEVQEYL